MQEYTAAHAADPILLATLCGEHVGDNVARLNQLSPDEAGAVLERLPLERVIQIFDRPELEAGGELLQSLPTARSTKVLAGMSADRAAHLLRGLDDSERTQLLASLDFETAAALKGLLVYAPDTAGALMTTEFVAVLADATVGETLLHLREVERSRETIYAIYVLDPQTHELVRSISLRRLIGGEPDQPITEIALPIEPVSVHPDTDREEVARLITLHDLLAVPVLNERGRVLGIVTVDDVIDAIMAESTEDVQRFGGVEAFAKPYLQIGFREMIRKRAGWLCALFLGEMLTASAMQHFEHELEKAIVLTLFIPLIMSSGGNSGSQATSLLIRALALGQLRLGDWWKVAVRELPTGLTLGAILGFIGMVRIAAWQSLGIYDYGEHWRLIALTVGTGLLGIVTFGSMTGSMLPFILKRLGFDPASASAPFVATLVDVSGLVIYFSVALVILNGTLL
ncbi:magnesium transporter [Phenylobacterium sp. LjRoot164]|uniref:magnesium transporter n=1 Tax=unclassified Phenylobacterium TaxID=2640670 RepID=UPI003ED042B3